MTNTETLTRRVWNETLGTYVTATIKITIDFDKIADEMVRKAVYNKSRKSTEVRGGVIVEAV